MKNFENKFTAWVDGTLSEEERNAFEQELAGKPEWRSAAEEDRQLGGLLRAMAAPAMDAPDFFNQRVLEKIAKDSLPKQHPDKSWWERLWIGWPRFAMAGAVALLLAVFIQKDIFTPQDAASSLASFDTAATEPDQEVLYAKSPDPKINTSAFSCPNDSFAVIWTEGVEYLPASYSLR